MEFQLSDLEELIPPFVRIEPVQEGTNEHKSLSHHPIIVTAKDDAADSWIQEVLDEHDSETVRRCIEGFCALLSGAAEGHGYATVKEKLLCRLDIALITSKAKEIIQTMSPAYMATSTILYIIHPPHLKETVVKALARLPLPPDFNATDQKLFIIAANGETYVFPIESYEMDLPEDEAEGDTYFFMHLFNPIHSTLIMQVSESGIRTRRDASLAVGNTAQVESWAISVIEHELLNKGMKIDYEYEPNGHTSFPDFEADINGKKWAIEVTRVLGSIPKDRIVVADARDRNAMTGRALRRAPIDHTLVESALIAALDSKRSKRRDCKVDEKYCLVLVNSINLDIGGTSSIWNGKDLTDFDTVILIHTSPQPTVEYIKGSLVDANAA